MLSFKRWDRFLQRVPPQTKAERVATHVARQESYRRHVERNDRLEANFPFDRQGSFVAATSAICCGLLDRIEALEAQVKALETTVAPHDATMVALAQWRSLLGSLQAPDQPGLTSPSKEPSNGQ